MGAMKVAIVVPQKELWIVRRINNLVIKQGYILVAAHNGSYVYHNQQKESHSIAVIVYADDNGALPELKYASDVLLLWVEPITYTPVRLVADVADGYGFPFMAFELKNKSNSGTSVNLEMLSPSVQSVIAHLKDITTIEKAHVGAAIVHAPSPDSYEAFDSLIHAWIESPSKSIR